MRVLLARKILLFSAATMLGLTPIAGAAVSLHIEEDAVETPMFAVVDAPTDRVAETRAASIMETPIDAGAETLADAEFQDQNNPPVIAPTTQNDISEIGRVSADLQGAEMNLADKTTHVGGGGGAGSRGGLFGLGGLGTGLGVLAGITLIGIIALDNDRGPTSP